MDACQRKRYLLRFIFLLVVFLSCIQYVDADCNITTPGVHTFGSECQYMCHCKNGESCNTTTGECTSGCDKYWFGPGCQYRDLAENEYSRHASNLVNSPHQYAPRGNDGDISTCSFTKEAGSSTVNPWWRVILENEVTITDIDILTTTDGLQYLHEFKVTVEKLPYSKKGSHDRPPDTIVCYQHNNTIPDNTNIHVTCTSPLIGNQVRITLSEIQSQLIVCDCRINRECTYNKWGPSCQNECGACIQGTCGVVTGKCTGGCLNGYINTDDSCKTECVSGLYGYNCQSNCSEHCKNSCDKVNGTCIDGCNPGYIGDKCERECQAGTYGQNCQNKCYENCNFTCHHVNGSCTRCNAGWKGDNCNTECDNGTYGIECQQTCSNKCLNVCNKVNGACTSCIAGWTGNYCDDKCLNGTYGLKCSEQCNSNCIDICNHVTGKCTQCMDGWKGDFCDEECRAGTYGQNCQNKCYENCNLTCHHVNGTCTSCNAGWKGDNCNTECDNGTYGIECQQTCTDTCLNGCNTVNGACTSCIAGWTGNYCDDKCLNGTYGLKCSEQCNSNCLDICDHVTGKCTQCMDGWKGDFCDEDCPDGTYGANCTEPCTPRCLNSCNKQTGNCTQCIDGWTGNICETECTDGTYGQNCNYSCSAQCTNVCAKDNGYCNCTTGWHGDTCQDECEDGSYGDYCKEQCGNCKDEIICDKINGTCHEGCDSGFEGSLCTSKIVQPPPPNEGFPVAAIAGIVSSVVVIVIIVVIVFIVIKRRSGNKNNGYTESTDNTETGWKNVSGNHKKNGSDNLKIVYSVKHDDPVYENSIDLLPQPDEMNDVHLQPTASSSKSTTNTEKGDVNDYYVFGNEPVGEKSLTAIALNNLTQYVKSKIANVNFFNNEFQDIPYGLQHPTLNATKPSNMGKNRYKELFAYDHARVVLKTLPTEPNSDYINASYIKGYKKDRAYIAAQGPTENNENEFWRMVWENNVNLIVMLTKLIEETKTKCVQYWAEKGNSKTFGRVTVFTESEEEFAEFTVRRLKITYGGKKEERIVTHYIYTAWPDKNIPHSTCSLLQFWHKVRKHDANKTKPWLVHCSAGVGRTGTFIALDYLYDQGVDAGFIDINVCVRQLRNQRVNMVQVKEQYRYLYRIMIEALILPSTPILVHNFDAYYTDLLMEDQKTRKPKIKSEFETILQNQWLVKDTKTQEYACKDAKLAVNKFKNRYSNILAPDEFRPFMSTHVPGTTNYINAIYMPSYSDMFSYIITQTPLPDTAVDYCRLIIDQDINVVVTFNDDDDNEVGVYLPSKGSIEVGPFEVTLNNEEVKHGYVIRRHTLTLKSKEHEVVQVVCQNWPTNKLVPEDPSTMLQILQDITDLHRHNENKPVLLQCLNGAERSGLFVVLLNIIERSRIEEEVSIVQVVRHLRSRRPQIVPNFEQYKFCHDVLLSYTESDSTYANL